MPNISYDKLDAIFQGVCLAQAFGPQNSYKKIRNCIYRSKWYWINNNESWEDGFVRIVMSGEYRDKEFMRHCRYFGEGSCKILDEVRAIAMEWGA